MGAIAVAVARFDTQLLRNPDISGKDYQKGLLYQSNLREYVLHRDGHRCRYCHVTGTVLNLDHVVPRSRGGATRPDNLVACCIPCNETKSNATAAEFGYPEVQAHVDVPLRDAAYMNATRYEIAEQLGKMGLPVAISHGGVTRANRVRLGLAKNHYVDALCVGNVAGQIRDATNGFLSVLKSHGRGSHQRSKPVFSKPCWGCGKTHHNDKTTLTERKSKALKYRNKFCLSCRRQQPLVDNGHRRKERPVRFYTRTKASLGFSTGDLVEAKVPSGKHKGTYVGRVGMRESGTFKITVGKIVTDGISHRHCRLLERGNGWSVSAERRPVLLPALTDGASAPGEAG